MSNNYCFLLVLVASVLVAESPAPAGDHPSLRMPDAEAKVHETYRTRYNALIASRHQELDRIRKQSMSDKERAVAVEKARARFLQEQLTLEVQMRRDLQKFDADSSLRHRELSR